MRRPDYEINGAAAPVLDALGPWRLARLDYRGRQSVYVTYRELVGGQVEWHEVASEAAGRSALRNLLRGEPVA